MNQLNTWQLRLLDNDYKRGIGASWRRKRSNARTSTVSELAATLGVTRETVLNRYRQHFIQQGVLRIPIDIAAKIVADDLERKLFKASKVKAKSLDVDKGK